MIGRTSVLGRVVKDAKHVHPLGPSPNPMPTNVKHGVLATVSIGLQSVLGRVAKAAPSAMKT